MKRPTPDDVDRLKLEHEAMASTLCEAENHVPEETMKLLRRYYADYIVTSREHAAGSRRCPKGGTHVVSRRDGLCLKCDSRRCS